VACYVVVSGLPGSGKTTLARALAGELRIPLLSKDVIKEALYDGLGIGDVDWSKQLGAASMDALFALASDTSGAVLESFWDREHAPKQLASLGRPVIEIHCDCGTELARKRFRARVGADRHPGHLDGERERDFDDWLETGRGEPLALGGPFLTVATESPVDVGAVAGWIREQPAWDMEPVPLTPTAALVAFADEIVAALERSLRELLPACRIEHVGATSMPDGVTKGDVDINIRVSPNDFPRTVERLRAVFPVAQPHNWTESYASFSDTTRALPVGLQVTAIGSPDDFLVPLRDLMRTDAELRHRYERCKREAALLGPDGYWAAKNALLTEIRAQMARSRSAQ
jgi:predicted kinase/GrpB-like predicted nucleotidyltransferase (UPF0157 family)